MFYFQSGYQTMPKQLTAGDLCTRAILWTAPETLVTDALQLMAERQKSSLLAKLHHEAIGIVTERDIVRSFAKIAAYPDLAVRDIMSSPLLTIATDDNALDVFRQMRENRIRHFAVLDRNYAPFGLLSLTDLIYKFAPGCIPVDVTVSSVMAQQVALTDSGKPVRQVLGEMAHRGVSCMVVCAGHKPVGMFSERDVPQILLSAPPNLDQPVAAVMTSLHPAIPPETPAIEAIMTMHTRGIRRLIVTDGSDNIVGLVTQTLLGRAIAC